MLAQQLKEILVDRALQSTPPDSEIVLSEPNVMQVSVVGVPTSTVVINLNRIGSPRGIENGPCKRSCDYVMVFRSGKHDGVLFVELKRTLRDGIIDGHEQLRRSLPILYYLERMCAIHFETCGDFPIVRYVLIGERGSPGFDKQRVRRGQGPYVTPYKSISVTSVVGRRVAFASLWHGKGLAREGAGGV